jgi:hypothetical protein
MQGSFSDDALEAALFGWMEEGVIADFSEYFDFGATCMRPDGTLYGISGGKCRKGQETDKAAPKPKRGRPKGGKNVAKTAPGEAAARMKAAYDRLVGMDLSRAGGGDNKNLMQDLLRAQKELSIVKDVPAHMPGRKEEISRLEKKVAAAKAKLATAAASGKAASVPAKPQPSEITPKNVLAKLEDAKKGMGKWGDAMERLQGPSGHVAEKDKAEWNKAYDQYGKYAKDYKAALDKQADYKRLYDDVAQRANKVGQEHMREKDPGKRQILESRYNKLVGQLDRLDPAFTQEGTNTWMARLGISEVPASTYGSKSSDKSESAKQRSSATKEVVLSQRALEKDVEKKLQDWNRAQLSEEKAYKNLQNAKQDQREPEKIDALRKTYKEKVAENDKAEREWRDANAKVTAAANKGQTLLTRQSDRPSVEMLKKEAKDYQRLVDGMQGRGVNNTDLAVARIGLEARKDLIKDKKQYQDERIVNSMNLSPAAKAVQRLNGNAERKAGVKLREAQKLREAIKNEKDPSKKAKLQKNLDEAVRLQLLARDEVQKNWDKYNAAKQASKQKAEAILADAKQAPRIRKLGDDLAAASLVVKDLNRKQQNLDAAFNVMLQRREAAETRLALNQQRANKYASMIANAKSPSEKQLLQDARKKAQPVLNREATSAMKAMAHAEKALAKIEKARIKVGDDILKAQKARNDAGQVLDKIKAKGTAATDRTKYARQDAASTLKSIEHARKAGKLEILGGARPDLDLDVGAGSGSKRLSAGAYGTTFRKGDATIKYGRIGQDEASAMGRAHAAGVGPQVFKGERVQGRGESDGRFAYEYVKGKPLMDMVKAGNVPMAVKEEFWKNRAKMHLIYVAHNDLHPGNAIVGRNGSVKFIDFGLARVGEKAALGEALGMNRIPGRGQGNPFNFSDDGDRQAKRWGRAFADGGDGKIPANLQRIMDNRQNVERAMIKDGFSRDQVKYFMDGGNYFRADDGHFQRANWANMSDDAAARYLNILYDGVV